MWEEESQNTGKKGKPKAHRCGCPRSDNGEQGFPSAKDLPG